MDAVQRKLELIDKQLAGRDVHKKIISTCPLLFAAVGLIIGILIQHTYFESRVTSRESQIFWLILLALLTVATVVFFIIQQSSSTNYQYATAYLALVCFACLGAVRLTNYYQAEPNNIRNFVGDERKLATIRGLITTEPYIEQRRWQFAKFMYTDPGSSFYLKTNKAKTVDGWTKVTGTVRVRVAEPVLDLKAGDYIQAYCWLDRFKEATNPGQFNTAKYLARKNVFIAASVKSRDGIEILRSAQNDRWSDVFTKTKRKLRQTATQALVGNLSLEDRNRGLLEALLLGYRKNIDSSTYQAFRRTGLLHFISLSGLHLGILMGIIWWLCKTAGLLKPARAVICIIAIAIFLLIVPPRAPILRAAIICLVFCVSFFFRRRSNPINTLSLAAIILLLVRPTDLFGAGWQLSFTAVLGILVFTKKIENFLHERTGNWFWINQSEEVTFATRLIKKFGVKVMALFSVGLAAWLGSAGILLYHFYTINPLTYIWTVVAFPFVALILTIGFLKIILSFLLPTAAVILGLIVNGLSDLLIRIVERIAGWDISQILTGKVPAVVIVFYYSLILFAAFACLRRPLIKKTICTVMALAIVVFLGVTKWQRTHRDNLVLTSLDVGHGQAIFAQLPGKTNILFDAGSLHKSDIGTRVVAAFLDCIGINKIDAIIISHNDVDHINGIPEIAEYCKVGDVYANDAFFSRTDRWGTAKFLDDWLSERGFEIKNLKDFNLKGAAKIKMLWPSEQICQDETLGDNDKSQVCLIEFAGTEILLCSDIERFAQRELLRIFPNLKPEVVVVPHHSSAKTLEANFLENLETDILISSCDQRQYERQQTIKQKNKTRSFYTARDGAITVCIDKDGMIKIVSRAP